MRNVLIVVAGILSVVSFYPYVSDIIKNKTHPNLVTWITWMSVSLINTVAAINNHSYHTAILTAAITVGDGIIVVFSIKKGVKKYVLFDFICQFIAAIGVLIWIIADKPNVAVGLSILVIFIGALPTWRHAWLKPFEETWEGFVIGSIAGVLTLLSLDSYSFVAVAFPAALVVNTLITSYIILSRRQLVSKKAKAIQ